MTAAGKFGGDSSVHWWPISALYISSFIRQADKLQNITQRK